MGGHEAEEHTVLENFTNYVVEVQDLAEELLALKRLQLHRGLKNLNCDATALRDTFDSQPELNQDKAIQALDTAFRALRQEMEKSTIASDHALMLELDSFSQVLIRLTAEAGQDLLLPFSQPAIPAGTLTMRRPAGFPSSRSLPSMETSCTGPPSGPSLRPPLTAMRGCLM